MYNLVTDTPFFNDIIEDENRNLVASKFIERTFPKGQILYQYGDEGHEMYIIKSGSLKIYRQDEGHEIIFGHQFLGEAIGELELFHYDNRRTASVATIEPTTLWVIKRQDMDELVKLYPEILRKTIYILSERLTQADRKLEYLGFLDTRVRVANLLLDLYSNFGIETEDGRLINWKITQQHFASMIGVGRESAARVLQEFKSEGIIGIQNKLFYILDLQAIQKITGNGASSGDERRWHSTHKYDTTFV
ncbi:CRP/FNR family transcriptional regulator [Paenibacillus sp. DS2015]